SRLLPSNSFLGTLHNGRTGFWGASCHSRAMEHLQNTYTTFWPLLRKRPGTLNSLAPV
ncbi:hypothetical protein DXG03_007707, partial [Asterophora parasitica]